MEETLEPTEEAVPRELSTEEIAELVASMSPRLNAVYGEMCKRIVGQHHLVQRLLIGLISSGHVLLEGLPGLAKTTTVNAMAAAIDCQFQRIQFTPDLLPADLIGTLIFNAKENAYTTHQGPLFSNIVLADEINRAPAKVQSALLEAMQEHQVTIGSSVYKLPQPYLVLATQNPIEQEGTYPLPEAQMDRFMMKVMVEYPTAEEELVILERMGRTHTSIPITPITNPGEILQIHSIVDLIYIDPTVARYVVALVGATRNIGSIDPALKDYVRVGASPRATINLTLAGKAHAFLCGRGFVAPEDIKAIAMDVLRHRIILSYEAAADEVSREDIVSRIIEKVPVP